MKAQPAAPTTPTIDERRAELEADLESFKTDPHLPWQLRRDLKNEVRDLLAELDREEWEAADREEGA